MQKFNEPCIKTGDFAKLCNTNKRTLFHYDEIGLFSPVYTDKKGYRFYTESQCDVFFTITCLKELGMPLKDIKTYIDHRNPSGLEALLLEQKKRVEKELERLQRIRQVIHTKLRLVQTGEQLQFSGRTSQVFCDDQPKEYLISSPCLNTSDHQQLFTAICQHISYCSRHQLNTGHPYGAILPTAALERGDWDTYTCFFTKVSSPVPGHPQLVKPAGRYAVIYLQGNYYDAGDAYLQIFAFARKHRLQLGESCYKEAIWDEITVDQEADYITKISISILPDYPEGQ